MRQFYVKTFGVDPLDKLRPSLVENTFLKPLRASHL